MTVRAPLGVTAAVSESLADRGDLRCPAVLLGELD
jgi:hypothetical protein